MLTPWRVFEGLWKYPDLVWTMVKRDVAERYRGSAAGLLWSLFNPLFMLVVYTLVFSGIFGAQFSHKGTIEANPKASFAVVLFAGLNVFLLFQECVNRSPGLIIQHANYVKKVVFPLEILPWVALGAAGFQLLVSTAVLLVGILVIMHTLPWTIIFFPLPVLCIAMVVMGCSWILSSLGVFLRDLIPTVLVITNVLMFLSPIFYSREQIHEPYYTLLGLNPITFIIEQSRDVLVWGQLPNFWGLGIYFVASTLFAWVGLWWFQKTRRGFADVI